MNPGRFSSPHLAKVEDVADLPVHGLSIASAWCFFFWAAAAFKRDSEAGPRSWCFVGEVASKKATSLKGAFRGLQNLGHPIEVHGSRRHPLGETFLAIPWAENPGFCELLVVFLFHCRHLLAGNLR